MLVLASLSASAFSAGFDPFNAPRGPPLEKQVGGEPNIPTPPDPPADPDDADVRLGARVIGSISGGVLGNKLLAGLDAAGLTTCSPFDLDGCGSTPNPPPVLSTTAAPASSGPGLDADNFIANILRNPTSIFPQEWKLEGRSYIDDVGSPPANAQPNTMPAPVPSTPAVPAPLPAPEVGSAAPLAEDVAKGVEELSKEERIALIREEMARLQGTISPDAFTTSAAPPIGVPPAYAAAPDSAALVHSTGGEALLAQLHALYASEAAIQPALVAQPHHQAAAAAAAFPAGFSAIADGGPLDAGGAVLGTLIFAAIGALGLEYVATNKVPPIPDPLLSGIWSSVHGAARFVSKYAGKAIGAVRPLLPGGN